MTTRCNCWVHQALIKGEDLRGFGNEVHSRDCPLYQPANTPRRRNAGIIKCEEGQGRYRPAWVTEMERRYSLGITS